MIFPPYERENCNVALRGRESVKKIFGGIVTREAKRYITDLFSGDIITQTHIVRVAYYFVTHRIYVEAVMDHGCEGSFGIVAMECKRICRVVCK